VATLGTTIGRSAEIVAAVRAEAGAMKMGSAQDGTQAKCGEYPEEKGEDPVGEVDSVNVRAARVSDIAEAEK
jgi:hypothetical protein